ncbi:MAG TPA: bifunctional isocitrate dehydrogenase kinase/phosphatase [Acidobacteriota bacterium]|nr:bifunctional isocitrate dehydrogenase kinase/phosphatase [Acidobacteriota bacterium]
MTPHQKATPKHPTTTQGLAQWASECIRDAYEKYSREFARVTRRAKRRFERADWQGRYKDALERLDLNEKSLEQVNAKLRHTLGVRTTDVSLWMAVKRKYTGLITGRYDIELAETFFNSVTRKVLMTVGVNREVEYLHLEDRAQPDEPKNPIYRTYVNGAETRQLIRGILQDHDFAIRYEDIDRDAALVATEVELFLWPIVGYDRTYTVEVIRSPFYRNKVAYTVGRIRIDSQFIPFILPLYNEGTGIYVDTVLLSEAEASRVFGFAHSYFHIEIDRHDALIGFLKSILPQKPVSELYASIGCPKHGKTRFYKDLHRFVHESKEQFVIAPGKEGAVMIVFTLPDYNFVFKVIKDRPCFLRSKDITVKTISRSEVVYHYSFVCHRDRVGRMVDTLEFENLRFRRKRFSRQLLDEFRRAGTETIDIEDEHVVIHHVYVQRKVTPLPIYLATEKHPEAIRRVIIDFGYFLKDLAGTGIFPCDLFNTWNYGVTRQGRVVLFDYDDVQPLETTHFRVKPEPRDEYEETQLEENWITATPDDFFMDEIDRYSGIPKPLKGIFDIVHADLYTIAFWREMKRKLKHGELPDITPYDRRRKFRQRK